ncbi:hypothetical protein MPLB_1120076 [Mesorhizobium sp. ORS 3324]|nr:hypothetical protein MPLB_1120076 [Mesorhizobium sp. ORS 3324]
MKRTEANTYEMLEEADGSARDRDGTARAPTLLADDVTGDGWPAANLLPRSPQLRGRRRRDGAGCCRSRQVLPGCRRQGRCADL